MIGDTRHLGVGGFRVVTDSADGPFYALVADGGAATFQATAARGDDLPSAERGEGVVVMGFFEDVTVSDGTVLAYSTDNL